MTIRKRILTRDPICKACEREGSITAESASCYVDHILSLAEGGTDDDGNLEGQCERHYRIKTQAEAARGQGRAGPRVRPRIMLDGWPEDR